MGIFDQTIPYGIFQLKINVPNINSFIGGTIFASIGTGMASLDSDI